MLNTNILVQTWHAQSISVFTYFVKKSRLKWYGERRQSTILVRTVAYSKLIISYEYSWQLLDVNTTTRVIAATTQTTHGNQRPWLADVLHDNKWPVTQDRIRWPTYTDERQNVHNIKLYTTIQQNTHNIQHKTYKKHTSDMNAIHIHIFN